VDWRDGFLDWAIADGRRAVPFCAQLRRVVARSQARGRIAMVILDNLGIHTPKGSRLLRALLEELGEDLVLVYTPTDDPDANRIEWLWRALRRTVTTPTNVTASKTWSPTPTGGPTRSLRRRCCRRSAARSHPTSSRLSARNSTMRQELPGSI
jgi:hypothetical protein